MSKQNKGLGRGIDALFENLTSLEATSAVDEETVIELPIHALKPNPYQPRKTFDDAALKELAQSIEQSGVFQPILVRKYNEHTYEIIAGERRFRASQLANKTTIPAIIRQLTDTEMMQLAILENLQREDLNALEEAQAYATLLNHLDITQEELATRLGKSRPYIANYLRLLRLPPNVQHYVQTEALSVGHAKILAGLKDTALMEQYAEQVLQEQLSVRQLEVLLKQKAPKKPKKTAEKTSLEATFQPYLDHLEEQIDAKVRISGHKNQGKLEITYTSKEDLLRILDELIQHDS